MDIELLFAIFFIIIIFIISLSELVYLMECGYSKEDKFFSEGLILLAVVVFFLLLKVAFNQTSKPTAMDVYQGKTTLEITYKDSIPVDSVVVWKDIKN